MSQQYIVFSHGQEGEPWGTKIVAMAEVAKRHGLSVESVDYRGMADPVLRVERLLEVCRKLPGQLLLVGSSLGAHVCTTVSTQVPTRGLFLLAPAFFMPGYEKYTPAPPACPVDIVHGWNDDIVPVENSIRYARQYKCALHILDSDHRLTANITDVCALLDHFLRRTLAPA
ncbi:MAG TPA: alpha/beta fold hydrolase [Steroidobacter sp.]|uniref:alpha/beta hydrolase n=1 Tax=Steroidobacter sp. TaxID=1978227 RepID=UPI002EDAFB3B